MGTFPDATIATMGMGTEWVGMVAAFGTSSTPTDWLACNGAAVSRSIDSFIRQLTVTDITV